MLPKYWHPLIYSFLRIEKAFRKQFYILVCFRLQIFSVVKSSEVIASRQNCCTKTKPLLQIMTESTMATKVCKFYRTGYCKFTTKCKFFHQEESCEGHCPGKGCKLRHPKLCKYGERCRRKDKCVYKHKSSATKIDFKLQIEELTKSVKTL